MGRIYSKWISVKDRLPDAYTFVLVFEKRNGTGEPSPISIARWDGILWQMLGENDQLVCEGCYQDFFIEIDQFAITHWMTLPLPPSEDK